MKPSKLKKQKLLKTLLQKFSSSTSNTSSNKIDYILYIGADTGNESVYQFLKSKRSDMYFTKVSRDHNKKYICTLGKKPSSALFYIDDVEEVKYIFERLKATALKRKRIRSYGDLRDIDSTASPFDRDELMSSNTNHNH